MQTQALMFTSCISIMLPHQSTAAAGTAGSSGAAVGHADSFLIGHCAEAATTSEPWKPPNPGTTTSTCQGMKLYF
jgi:hypothetical protein